MSRSKRKLAALELLESRTLLSTTPLVMGYLADYRIADKSNVVFSENSDGTLAHDNLNWKTLKEVNYFALLPNATPAFNKSSPSSTPEMNATSNGGLQSTTDSGFSPAVQLPTIVQEATKNGAKVFVTVGGGDPNAIYDMDALVNTPSAFAAFAANIKSFCNTYGLAGVDLDWEPTAQDGFTVTKTQIDNFGQLIKTIKTNDPGLKLTSDALGDPVELSDSSGNDTGKSAFMLNAVAVANLAAINVEAYPVASKSVSDQIMVAWKNYVATGSKDLDGVTVVGNMGQLQYGLDIDSDDTSNKPANVIEGKVDATINNGYGGIFVFELDADTANPSVITRIGTEITKDAGAGGGSVSGSIKTSGGADVANVTVYLDANNNGALESTEIRTATNSSGVYSFTNVPPGGYVVRQVLPSGDTQTSPTKNYGFQITITNGASLTGKNFIDTVPSNPTGGSVSGSIKTSSGAAVPNVTVYLDANNNGARESGEITTTTTASGTFSFSNVPAGSYVVRQVLPSGDTQTSPTKNYGFQITVTNGVSLTGKNFIDTVPSGPKELTGTLIGSTNSLNHAASGHGAANVFDNNVSTVFEDTQANGNWVGLDLGTAKTISEVKYAADPANPSFMEGGISQGSSVADFSSNVVNLYQVPNTSIPSTSLTTVSINNSGSFRYVRYLPPAGSFGDVAEVDFYS
jgi:GH18 family chitinase